MLNYFPTSEYMYLLCSGVSCSSTQTLVLSAKAHFTSFNCKLKHIFNNCVSSIQVTLMHNLVMISQILDIHFFSFISWIFLCSVEWILILILTYMGMLTADCTYEDSDTLKCVLQVCNWNLADGNEVFVLLVHCWKKNITFITYGIWKNGDIIRYMHKSFFTWPRQHLT